MNASFSIRPRPTAQDAISLLARLDGQALAAVVTTILDDPARINMPEAMQDALLRTSGQFTTDYQDIIGSVEDEYGNPRNYTAEARERLACDRADMLAKERV